MEDADIGDHDPLRHTPAAPDGARHVPPPEVPRHDPAGAAPAPAGPSPAPAAQSWPEAGSGRPWPEAPPAQTGESGERPWSATAPGPPPEEPRPSRAAGPDEPLYLPRADWRWPAAVAGLLAGVAPQALLQLAVVFTGETSSSTETQTAAGAVGIVLASLVLYGWQVLAAWLFSLRAAGRSLVLWGFRRPERSILWVVPLDLVASYAVGIVHDVIVHPEQQAIVGQFPHSLVGAIAFILVAVVLAPLFEEIVFRGFLFRGLANSFGWVWGALVSAGLFGIAHLQLDVFLPLAALGFFLAWSYRRTGSLWAPITMHAVFNAIAVLAWALIG